MSPARRIPTADDLARAVKLYHSPVRWDDARQAEWNRVTGQPDDTNTAMSTVLLEMADAVLAGGIRIDLGPAEGVRP